MGMTCTHDRSVVTEFKLLELGGGGVGGRGSG